MAKNRFIYDAESAIVPYDAAAVTATGNTAAKSLDRPVVRGAGPGIAHLDIAVVFEIFALDLTTGDETYRLDVEVDTDPAFPSPVVVATKAPKGVNKLAVILDAATLEIEEPGAAYIRVKHTLAGTTPSIRYAAYLAPNLN